MDETDKNSRTDDPQERAAWLRAVQIMLDEGTASPQQRRCLEQLLREDDEALRQYVEMVDLDARLRWTYRGGLRVLPTTPLANSSENEPTHDCWDGISKSAINRAAAQGDRRVSEPVEAASQIESPRRRESSSRGVLHVTRRRDLTMIAAAASVAAMVILFASIGFWADDRAVGTLTQSAAAEWSEPHASLTTGDRVFAGEMSLVAGVVEFTLPDDTRLIVEGPATFEVQAGDRAFLKSGTATVFVGELADGYSLETPDTRIVDLGTAFQAIVVDGGTEVHVIEGEIMAAAVRPLDGDQPPNELRLSARDAVRFDRNDGSVSAVDFVGERLKLHGNAPLSAIPLAVTGDIRCLDHPPESVAVGEFERDDLMFLFLEHSNVVLDRTIYADRNAKGDVASEVGNANMKISAGSRINSYLLHFDPTTDQHDDPVHRVAGTVTFRSPIAGLFVSGVGLYESDKQLSSHETRYSRGEGIDGGRSFDALDFVSFSPDRKTLIVNLRANHGADQIRIITQE